jgi:hypothetical protein
MMAEFERKVKRNDDLRPLKNVPFVIARRPKADEAIPEVAALMRLLRAEALATTVSDCFVAPLLAMTGRAEIQRSRFAKLRENFKSLLG